jgi:ATP-dependent DNA helicase PIF1
MTDIYQEKVLDLFYSGKNVLVLGKAGTGKSFCIDKMRHLAFKNVAITSTTGISAFNIRGCTIHSFSGIGSGEEEIDVLTRRIKGETAKSIRDLDILIIDEVSMLSAELFEKLNEVYKRVRRNDKPFGGVQIILSGDFYQLPPVFNRNEELYGKQDNRLLFQSQIFNSIFNKENTIILKTVWRQKDPVFTGILDRIRNGKYTEDDIRDLKKKSGKKKEKTIHLVVTNKQAKAINMTELEKIKEEEMIFEAKFTSIGDKEMCNKLKKELVHQFTQREILKISLKKGARVMLLKNLDTKSGLINGSIGTISELNKESAIVIFDHMKDKPISIMIDSWSLSRKNDSVTAYQFPLMLAWSCTIHKSQSLTLDNATLDIQRCFCDGQVYVALSRLKTLEGMYLKSFSESKIKVNKKVVHFMEDLESKFTERSPDTDEDLDIRVEKLNLF